MNVIKLAHRALVSDLNQHAKVKPDLPIVLACSLATSNWKYTPTFVQATTVTLFGVYEMEQCRMGIVEWTEMD